MTKALLPPSIGLLIVSLLVSTHVSAISTFECLISPTKTVKISSPVVGLLETVHVRRGDSVKEGQVIASLHSEAETAATELARYKSEMEAPLLTAQNKIDFTKRKFERRQEMHAESFMSQQDVDDAENEFNLAASELKLALENKELAKLEWQQQNSLLNLRTIRSPFEGVVVEQNIYSGEVVEPSGQENGIMTLAQLNPLRVSVILPMEAFGKVSKGMEVGVKPELPIGGEHKGSVKIIDRMVDAASGTFVVFLDVPNPELTIPAGVKCQAQFPIAVENLEIEGIATDMPW